MKALETRLQSSRFFEGTVPGVNGGAGCRAVQVNVGLVDSNSGYPAACEHMDSKMTSTTVDDFVTEVFNALRDDKLALPSLPDMAIKVAKLVDDEDSSFTEIASLIVEDPAVSGRVIQMANSPLLGGRVVINSVETAISRMGRSMLKSVVTFIVLKQLYVSSNRVINRRLDAFWSHAREVASLAVFYGSALGHIQKDQALLAGMVHNIGVLPVLTMAEDHPEILADEKLLDAIIKRAHMRVGTALLDSWMFPEEIVKAAMNYLNLQYDSGDTVDYVDLVIAANLSSRRYTHLFRRLNSTDEVPALRKLGIVESVEYMELEAL